MRFQLLYAYIVMRHNVFKFLSISLIMLHGKLCNKKKHFVIERGVGDKYKLQSFINRYLSKMLKGQSIELVLIS